jgi:3-oxoacyl-[acyl-carrier-protein] synthase II
MKEHRVVITGLGAVTPIGVGVKDFWEGLIAGRNGIAKVTHFDITDFRSKLAAEVKDFHAEEWINEKSAKRMEQGRRYHRFWYRRFTDDRRRSF